MASDVPHQQHTLRVPVSAAMSGTLQFNNGRPVIINLGTADAEAASAAAAIGNSAAADPAPVPATLPSVRSLLMSSERSLPFILIILAKLLYDHRLGMYLPHLEML